MSQYSYLSIIPTALVAVNATLSVVYMNPAAEMLLGVSAQQMQGRALSQIPAFDQELCALTERVFRSGESIALPERTLKIPMNYRLARVHFTPFMEEGGRVQQVVVTFEKIEGTDRMAGGIWKQETMRAAGVMAAMLAHEVKNPLSGIRGAAQLLQAEVEAEHQPLADLICMEADRIRDLLNQVEIFGERAAEQLHPVNIHEVLQYVILIAKTGFATNITFKERYDPSLPEVLAHRDLLVQMFLNLVKNAAEALAGQPHPTITFSTAYRSGYRVRPAEGGADSKATALPVMVTIEDNGPGIPYAIRDRLFEPFVSSKEDGRGLGLSIIAKIASDLSSVVELDPDYKAGTRFITWLPVAG